MSDFDITSEYLKFDSELTTSSSSQEDSNEQQPKIESITLFTSKEANKAIDDEYVKDIESTATDDIRTYRLTKPRREIIRGILKND